MRVAWWLVKSTGGNASPKTFDGVQGVAQCLCAMSIRVRIIRHPLDLCIIKPKALDRDLYKLAPKTIRLRRALDRSHGRARIFHRLPREPMLQERARGTAGIRAGRKRAGRAMAAAFYTELVCLDRGKGRVK